MRVLLVGGGGRECALAWKIAQSPILTELLVVNDSPGWPAGAVCHPKADVVQLATEQRVDLVVVGPEAPLAAGLADDLEAAGVPCFGPSRAAAQLETSKAFTKAILDAVGVPTAAFVLATDRAQAEARARQGKVVIKVDGLAAGKGVFVCPTAAQAMAALQEIDSGRFGTAADQLVLEDLLEGPEVSLFALTDGERVVPLISAQDHKRLGNGDEGPNTGGMGAYAPCPLVDAARSKELVDEICTPVIRELARRGTPYRGVLFAGLMLTRDGPRVLEFNARFGDPECQPLMMLLEDDLLPWLHGAAIGRLPDGAPRFSEDSACCVVVASEGYPRTSTHGVAIPGGETSEGVEVFHAGTARTTEGGLVTQGGRVLGITARAESLRLARDRAYMALESWRFPGCQYRTDIAAKGLAH